MYTVYIQLMFPINYQLWAGQFKGGFWQCHVPGNLWILTTFKSMPIVVNFLRADPINCTFSQILIRFSFWNWYCVNFAKSIYRQDLTFYENTKLENGHFVGVASKQGFLCKCAFMYFIKSHFAELFINQTRYKTRFIRTCDLTVSCLKLILLTLLHGDIKLWSYYSCMNVIMYQMNVGVKWSNHVNSKMCR